ncbi:hypothetical protein L7F22_022219 [Adiantum nelumboides]|nr:hypothetical protein [Adiantum nelumboides]
MEDFIHCSNLALITPSLLHLQPKRHCQGPYQFFIAAHKQQQQQSIFTFHLNSSPHVHWPLARPSVQRTKLLALGTTSAAENIEPQLDALEVHEGFVNTADIHNEHPFFASNAQLIPPINAAAHCGNEASAFQNPAEILASTMKLSHSLTQNVYAPTDFMHTHSIQAHSKERIRKRESQQLTYLFAALASSVGITSLAAASVYYRFAWQMEGGEVPWTEMFGTFSLALGAAVGMEYWARWAHRALWHASLWSMHESHHQPRDGPFEMNDVFAIINAVPAIFLMAFGFFNKGLVPGLCFGAGLGITVFGIAYMFVHDGLVHRRFPVGPIADVPYFQKVAAAHQLHHAHTFNGVPYGLFLGPMELEEVGGRTELEKLVRKRRREKRNPIPKHKKIGR